MLLYCTANLSAQAFDPDLSDPTRPAARMAAAIDSGDHQSASGVYKVSQIYISQRKQIAIINGQKVKSGDSVDGAEVLAIKPGRVNLLVDGSITEITITPSIKLYKKK